MTWDAALAELSERLDDVEARLAAGEWEQLDIGPFAPPDVEGEMTPAQRERATMLLERLARCRGRLAEQMSGAQRELAELDARRRGARCYARSDG